MSTGEENVKKKLKKKLFIGEKKWWKPARLFLSFLSRKFENWYFNQIPFNRKNEDKKKS